MAKIDELFERMLQAGASDLHLSVGTPIRVRVNGDLIPLPDDSLSHNNAVDLIGEVMPEELRSQFDETRDVDFAISYGDTCRFRVNVFEHQLGLAACFRVIPSEIKSVDQLGLPKQVLKFCEMQKGLVLVTGATGSGKTTTLAALIDYINAHEKLHIITIEDPVEVVHKDKSCLVHQREVRSHTTSFAAALRASLREDPDVVMVGEMRDLETIELAITAAETGHLVFGTLHTTSAAKTTDRIINVFPTNQQEQIRTMLAESLAGVICQNLLKTANGKGRIAALEILIGTSGTAALIRDGKTHQLPTVIQTGRKLGMQTMDQALATLVRENKVTLETALAYATSKESFERVLAGGPEPPAPAGVSLAGAAEERPAAPPARPTQRFDRPPGR